MFFAFIPRGDQSGSQDTLHLICCPSHVREQVTKEFQERNINFPIVVYSEKKMIPGYDVAHVSLSGGIRALDEDDMENTHLRWLHLCIIDIINYNPPINFRAISLTSLRHLLDSYHTITPV